jgi:hypothetical protein
MVGGVEGGGEDGRRVDEGLDTSAAGSRQDLDAAAERRHSESLSRKMRGLRRNQRRKFTRTTSGRTASGSNQKESGFNYAALREENDLLRTANAQQITAAIVPAKARSPLSKVKRDRIVLRASLDSSAKKRRILAVKCHRGQEKIANLKRINNQLMLDILREKRASNIIIDNAMIDARRLSAKALVMMCDADEKHRDAQAQVIAERNLANARVREERAHHARASTCLRQHLEETLDKHNREQDAAMSLMLSKSDKKFTKLRSEMLTISNKLKDQRVIWQKRLSELDKSSKNQLSKERERRRSSIQQQLDKSSSTEDQLLEIIDGLEVMNDELADEAKQAKKDQRVAMKLYQKTKDMASARLEKLLTEKEAKNHLKDELASLLKVQQSQQILLDEYKIMIDGFQSSKLSLKQEVKLGRRGGARWPLWVTEVCCELLVNGSPPSAIPSSIGTLTATLYGDDPKKLPSLNYVRQCRVLVQIIGETITAMKLAACPNWAQIFFDSTTRRQIPFTAVVVSLMGDGPDSIDSIIVSSCVVLEDETSEKQVDGIVNKVSSWLSGWCICIAYFDMANMLQRLIL